MGLSVLTGNIFTTKCKTIVNTVNCVGIMGAGIALECRFRWPEMYREYIRLCSRHEIEIGKLWIFKASDHWILNFPTKKHWKDRSKEEYLHEGLREFLRMYVGSNIDSIAFPLLGAQHGGISAYKSQKIMESYLRHCAIPVEIYRYDPTAKDDVYESFKRSLLTTPIETIQRETKIRTDYVHRILEIVHDEKIHQLNQLGTMEGVGTKTLEKVFAFVRRMNSKHDDPIQDTLFDINNC